MITESVTAEIAEIFSSRQGEGLYAGQKQIFVRFSGCNLGCNYCDETAASQAGKLTGIDEVMREVSRLKAADGATAISLTGGEPLLHMNFLGGLLPRIKQAGLAVHLETNATMPLAFKNVCDDIDVVAADIKLPSATGRDMWDMHRKFLELCYDKVFVKIVITSDSKKEEVDSAVKLIESVCRKIPLILQPVTQKPGKPAKSADKEFINSIHAFARQILPDVRVLPQQHPIWGVK